MTNFKKKPIKITKLKKSADHCFSLFVRLRDVVHVSFGRAYCKCVTCGKIEYWRDVDAGHFATRNHLKTRFDERNVNAQCKRCNNFGKGEQAKHGFAIDSMYGEGTAKQIIEISQIRGYKISKNGYTCLIKTYIKKAIKEAEKKGLDLMEIMGKLKDVVKNENRLAQIREDIKRLDELEYLCLVLKHIEGLNYQEINLVLDVNDSKKLHDETIKKIKEMNKNK